MGLGFLGLTVIPLGPRDSPIGFLDAADVMLWLRTFEQGGVSQRLTPRRL